MIMRPRGDLKLLRPPDGYSQNKNGNFKKNKYGYLTVDVSVKNKYMCYNKNRSALTSLKKFVRENEWDENKFIKEITDLYFSTKILHLPKNFY